MKTLRDSWLIFDRSLWLTLRNPAWVVIGLMQPIMFLVLFGPLLDKIAQGPGFPAGGAWNVFVPGLLIQLSMFVGFAGFGLIAEQRAGVVERMRVTPMSRPAMLLGRSTRDVVLLLCQGAVLIAVAIPFGLHPDLPAIALTLGLLALIGFALAPTSYALGLWLKSEDAFAPLLNSITIPLLLLSGILLPMSLAPDWLRVIATFNPFAHAVDAARAAFTGNFGDPEIGIAVGLMAVLAVIAVWVAGRAFGRAVA
ncbi:MAG TPA: ABC transporter permease [Candidatus Limnocylindrales bacterium]|nr:ABC transporter permease [Candidatus Limnocylindrales bacterium]